MYPVSCTLYPVPKKLRDQSKKTKQKKLSYVVLSLVIVALKSKKYVKLYDYIQSLQ